MRQKETDLKIIQERYNKRLERQKEYNSKKYEYINIVLQAGKKKEIQDAAKKKGYKNANEYIKALIENDLRPDIRDITGDPDTIDFFKL